MRIIHCVERHQVSDVREVRRRKLVFSSWESLYAKGVVSAHLWDYPRDSSSIGDHRKLPFLKDVFSAGRAKAEKNDIVMWTNDDIVLHPEIISALKLQVGCFDVCSAHRCEFLTQDVIDLNWTPTQFEARKRWHGGRDLFACTAEWMDSHWDGIPDFVLGSSEFDYCLASMVRNEKGFHVNWRTMHLRYPLCELPFGYVLHEMHTPKWITLGNDAAQQHNRRLLYQWATRLNLNIKFGDTLNVIDC